METRKKVIDFKKLNDIGFEEVGEPGTGGVYEVSRVITKKKVFFPSIIFTLNNVENTY